jgi:hypothetical protein
VGGPVFWKITGAGASFQAGSAAVDSATIVASLVHHLTGSVYAVGAASAVLRLGWLLPQLVVGFLAQRVERRIPFWGFATLSPSCRSKLLGCAFGAWPKSKLYPTAITLSLHFGNGLFICKD